MDEDSIAGICSLSLSCDHRKTPSVLQLDSSPVATVELYPRLSLAYQHVSSTTPLVSSCFHEWRSSDSSIVRRCRFQSAYSPVDWNLSSSGLSFGEVHPTFLLR